MTACESIATQLGGLFSCVEDGKRTKVKTPFLYPDGDSIDLYVREHGDTIAVSDLGESIRWLRGQSLSIRRTPRQRQLIEDICLTERVEMITGMLVARVRKEELASAVMRVGQASLRVADIWFTLRNRTFESIADDVAEFLTDRKFDFARREPHVGRTGKSVVVDFHVRSPEKSSFVNVLATGNRASARPIAEHVLAVWYELSHLRTGGANFISLFDDTVNVWGSEEFKLVEGFSQVARWSRPDEFEHALREAA